MMFYAITYLDPTSKVRQCMQVWLTSLISTLRLFCTIIDLSYGLQIAPWPYAHKLAERKTYSKQAVLEKERVDVVVEHSLRINFKLHFLVH